MVFVCFGKVIERYDILNLVTLADLSEEKILAKIFPHLISGENILLGPGDDAGVVRVLGNSVVVSSDMQVENRDFRSCWSTGFDNGWKLAAQNLADIAAMGGVAVSMVVNIAAPETTALLWVEGVVQGIAQACKQLGVPQCGVVGGDLSWASEKVLSMTVMGNMFGLVPVRRVGAVVGDVVALGGVLGQAAAGLFALESEVRNVLVCERFVRAQLRPEPPVGLGPVAAKAGVHAMLDVSDGLFRDALRVAKASGVSVNFFRKFLEPYFCGFVEFAKLYGVDAWDFVLNGGEDHGLLAFFSKDTVLPAGFTQIGLVESLVGGESQIFLDGEVQVPGGWDHYQNFQVLGKKF